MIGVLTLGLGVLAGGQVWAYSGSSVWGWGSGLAAAGLIGLGWRAFLKRAARSRRIRFLGESQEGVDESEFSEISRVDEARAKIEKDLEQRPQKVADSIRALLVRSEGEGEPGDRGSTRG